MAGLAALPKYAEIVEDFGRSGDQLLAHITPREAKLLKSAGGRGSTNPYTGILEFAPVRSRLSAPITPEFGMGPVPRFFTQARFSPVAAVPPTQERGGGRGASEPGTSGGLGALGDAMQALGLGSTATKLLTGKSPLDLASNFLDTGASGITSLMSDLGVSPSFGPISGEFIGGGPGDLFGSSLAEFGITPFAGEGGIAAFAPGGGLTPLGETTMGLTAPSGATTALSGIEAALGSALPWAAPAFIASNALSAALSPRTPTASFRFERKGGRLVPKVSFEGFSGKDQAKARLRQLGNLFANELEAAEADPTATVTFQPDRGFFVTGPKARSIGQTGRSRITPHATIARAKSPEEALNLFTTEVPSEQEAAEAANLVEQDLSGPARELDQYVAPITYRGEEITRSDLAARMK